MDHLLEDRESVVQAVVLSRNGVVEDGGRNRQAELAQDSRRARGRNRGQEVLLDDHARDSGNTQVLLSFRGQLKFCHED